MIAILILRQDLQNITTAPAPRLVFLISGSPHPGRGATRDVR